MQASKIYSKSRKTEKNHAAAVALAEIARKKLLDEETEELIRNLSRPRSKRYIQLMMQYRELASELEAHLAEESPAPWTLQEYHTDGSEDTVEREVLKNQLELLRQELEEIKKEVEKELPQAAKQMGIIYEEHNEGKLTRMGVINCPGTPIPSIEALDASMDYEDEQEERQWHKAYRIAEAAVHTITIPYCLGRREREKQVLPDYLQRSITSWVF